jgi:hypothetical protein
MIDPSLGHSLAAGGGLFVALQIVGEVRCEFRQLLSVLEAAIGEAGDAVALDCPARLRALDLGRVAADALAMNSRMLAELEVRLQVAHAADRGGLPH